MTETWRRQIISGSPLERLAAVEHCRSEGVRRYAAPDAELYEGNDPFTPLYDAGHAVLTALREIEETQAREGGDEQ